MTTNTEKHHFQILYLEPRQNRPEPKRAAVLKINGRQERHFQIRALALIMSKPLRVEMNAGGEFLSHIVDTDE